MILPDYEHKFLNSPNHKEIVTDTVAASLFHHFKEYKDQLQMFWQGLFQL
jgi:hypothetical protein